MLKCDLSNIPDAISAQERATTVECKQQIESLACRFQKETASLTRTCGYANNNEQRRALYTRGCLTPDDFKSHVAAEAEAFATNRTNNETPFAVEFDSVSSLQACIDTCLTQVHLKYAAFDHRDGGNCVCLRYLKSGFKESLAQTIDGLCTRPEQQFYQIYHTGLIGMCDINFKINLLILIQLTNKSNILFKKDIKRNSEQYEMSATLPMLRDEFRVRRHQLPRIVFLLTLNGRTVRQVFRLFKTIYNEHHFYFFHIDQV